MDNSLNIALKNLVENQATSEEMDLLRSAFFSGQIFIGGNVQNSIIIAGDGNTVQLSAEALNLLKNINNHSSLHQLPQPPADFIGREKELRKIFGSIEKKNSVAILGLIGMAGIGKTAMGLVIAHYFVNEYSDAQFFFNMRGTSGAPLTSLQVMKQVIQSFYPTADLRNANEDDLSGIFQSTLAEKKTILFLDNVHDASQVMPLRPPKNSLMLVTSRLHFTLPGLQSVELDVLNRIDAVRFLKEICPRLTKTAAQQIAELCGCLPIAVRLAGSYLSIHSDWTVAEYIHELTNRTNRLHALHLEGADASVEASFEQSYQQLSDDEKDCWAMLAIFPVSFKRDALASVWSVDDVTARHRASKLHQYSLLEYDTVTNRYRLHDLLSDFAGTKLSVERRFIAHLNYVRHYRNVWCFLEELYTKGGDHIMRGLYMFDDEYPHIRTAYEWSIENWSTNEKIAEIIKEIPDFVYVGRLRLHPDEQIKWFTACLGAAEKMDDRYNQNKLFGNIGVAYDSVGEFQKGIECYVEALKIAREIGDRKREGFWLGNLGADYADMGDYQLAIENYSQALDISREVGDLSREGFWLANIGVIHLRSGRYRQSIECFQQAQEIARETGNTQEEGVNLDRLGSAHSNLGENRVAIEYHEQALAIARRIGDLEHESLSLSNIGSTYISLGENRKAIEYLERSLEIAGEIGNRRQESFGLETLGVAYSNLGESRKCIKQTEQALEIARSIGDREREGSCLVNLGAVYYTISQYRKALAHLQQALGIAREVQDRQNEGATLNLLGGVHISLGKIVEAEEYLKQALVIAQDMGDRRREGLCLGNLGEFYNAVDEPEKANYFIQQAFDLANETLDRLQQGIWMGNQGVVYLKLGEYKQSAEKLEGALQIARETGDKQRECTWLNHLGEL